MKPAVRSRRVGRVLAAWLAAGTLAAPAARADWQNFRAAVDGLADNLVLSIHEAGDGALWFGTQRGASRFDGTRWSLVADSLPGLKVYDLLHDSRGESWYATISGLARERGGAWERYSTAGSVLPANTVQALLEDHRGDVWIGTTGGLVRYEPALERWTTYLEDP